MPVQRPNEYQGSRAIRGFLWFFLIYAAAIASYVWLNSPQTVPEPYRGTAADPATFLTAEQLASSGTINAVRNIVFFLSYPWEWGLYVILLCGGFARRWRDRLEAPAVPRLLRLPAYVLLLNAVSLAAFLPLNVVSYSMSRAYGISTQPVASWLRDKAVSFGINTLLMIAVTAVAFWIIGKGGRWWLKLWLLSVPFTLFMMYIQPVVIDPLYNQFSRLSSPELERKILDLAAKAHIPADRVYEVDMSEKTNALNAYVNGIGGSLRIVLWDTTLKRLDEPEILLIMAHEMGHYVMHHLEWSAAGAVVSSFFMLWIGSSVLLWTIRRKGGAWGIRGPSDPTALPLILLLASVVSFATLPVSNYVSRQAERAADNYAFELLGQTDGAAGMYQKLAASSLSEVNPPLLVKLFRSTHPSIVERIVNAEKHELTAP
ncbi:M48 family metalloprotease [Paenibacillus ginsengihumi]|uniref:M48 family metallopeptidase n=1 Tax=Paenibacillus ginsengihumi TaxID=431596 RepID=UPI0003793A4B